MSLSDNLRRLARERIPTGAGEVARSYHFYGACQRINSNQKLPHRDSPYKQTPTSSILGKIGDGLPS